jgi:hypothetical protein
MLVSLLAGLANAQDGLVTLPLERWEQMLDAGAAAGERPAPPVPVLQVERSIEGSFRRGVFTGTLVTRVRVPAGVDDLRVPVLDAGASIARVELDGRSTSLLPEEGAYTVGLDTPGDHVIRVDFFVGREDDRFSRRFQLALPASGPTRLSVWVPEVDIEASLAKGAVTALRGEAGGTRIEGQLDGRGELDLTWKGRLAGEAVPVKAEARAWALFTLHEAVVRGVLQLDTTVHEGETDRVVLRVPEGVEIVDVQGDAVLQWRTEADQLVVLLRYLVSDRASVRVQFQLPVDLDAPVALKLPMPAEGVPFEGALGVQGPAGLQATVQAADAAEPLRDLPPELAALTPNPLLLGFTFSAEPSVTVAVTRQAEVELTSTSVDSLEASTVLIEDGAEITRLQLHVRNETRQYLAARLPEGAVLTLARIDGRPIRPATAPDGALLLPLVQSDRQAGGEQTWVVRDGDTLGAIADRFYGDPSLWYELLDANRESVGWEQGISPGQVIRIPATHSGITPVSRFEIELAWTRPGGAMGWAGRRALELPALDADVAEAAWKVYVPHALEPLDFSGNLSAWSHLRYDHVRRLRQFISLVFGVRDAWAGGSYDNILSRRKSIYAAEVQRGARAQEATSTFPLVGEPYHFRRMLPGREVPALTVTWIARDLLPFARLGALLGAAWLVLAWLGGRRGVAVAGFAGLLGVAWFVEGVHRSLLWGVDLALLGLLARAAWPRWRSVWEDPPPLRALLDAWTLGRVAWGFVAIFAAYLLLLFPLAWGSVALLVLAWRVRRLA